MFTMGKPTGVARGAQIAGMWGPLAAKFGGSSVLQAYEKITQDTADKAVQSPQVQRLLAGADAALGKAETWSKFTEGFNSFVDPIFSFLGMDPSGMGTMQKMIITFGVLTALGGGASALFGGGGGMIGILGALLAAGGIFGPQIGEALGITGGEGAGDIAGAPKRTAAPPPEAKLDPAAAMVWGQLNAEGQQTLLKMTPQQQTTAVAQFVHRQALARQAKAEKSMATAKRPPGATMPAGAPGP